MRIWIFNHYAKPPYFSGGSRHYDMAKELIKNGHEVTIFASSYIKTDDYQYIDSKSKSKYKIDLIDEINFVWIKTRKFNSIKGRFINTIDYYKNLKSTLNNNFFLKPDIIIGSSVHLLAPILASKYSKKYKAKFYFEERDFWPQTFIDFGKISKLNPIALILFKIESRLYDKADKIIVLFDKADKYLISKGVSKHKILYLPNGITSKNIKSDSKIDRIFENYNNKKTIVYIGAHGQANELGRILELANEMKENSNIHFLFFGKGSLKNKLIKYKLEQNLDNVDFFNSVPKNNIPYLLKKSDIGIISIKDTPLYNYGFSMNKIYDYLYAGLPLIMIVTPSLAQNYIRDGVFVNNNLISQANNIVKLSEDENYYMYHAQKSYEFSYNFMWENQIKKLIDTF